MSIESKTNPNTEPEGKRIVYLKERGGGIHTKEFETRKSCRKYLGRHHDSVVSYEVYIVNEDGSETFIKNGTFNPRTKAEKRKSLAKLRRKRKAREVAKRERQEQRPTIW